ncbi:unnamed protein product, partial [Rotaria magnacalcarata]
MKKFYNLILTIYTSIIAIYAYTDPSVINPQLLKRFEYKLSFKGPHLAFKDGTVPFWTFGGSAIASDDQVRVTPSIRSQKGWIWTKNTMTSDNWLLDVKLRVNGRGRIGADGLTGVAIWFTEKPGVEGPVFGSNDFWNGLGVFLDSFDNDALQNNPIIAVMVNDGTKTYDHPHDGTGQIQGSCIRDFRNKPFAIRLKIEYINQGLAIYVNNGISQDDNALEFCTRIDGVKLPKTGYLGVSAETGGLADDHDVLEFLTNTYSDKQATAQNQAATDEQARKYKEEYETYERDLKKQQDDYQKEHPDLTTPYNEKALFESEYDREFRTILEGQDQIRLSLTSIDRKMIELLGRVERISSTTGEQQQITGKDRTGIPTDVARIQDINRVINANNDMSRTVQSFAQVLTDLQQKLNNLQANINNNQRPLGAGQQVVTSNVDGTVVNEIREIVKMIKSETNTLVQKSLNPMKCPTVTAVNDSSCVGTFTFMCAIVLQIIILIGFFAYNFCELIESTALVFFLHVYMLSITRNISTKSVLFSFVSRRSCRILTAEASPASKEQQEIDEIKVKQQKYQELEKLQSRPLYLDAQATTPMDPRVLDQMLPYMTHLYGNPHSRTHAFGWESEKAIETAREKVAKLINAEPKEIIFTSGATESNNISVKGVARFYKEKKKHVVTTQTEHKCVLDSMRVLESEGFKVTYLPVKKNGLIDLQELESVLTPETSLCSVMMINNEIGVLQPIKEIGKLCRSKKVFFHTDAAQSVGKIPIDVNQMNIDLLSISGHKIYGPKGIGALYIRRRPRVRLDPIQTGGGQERNIRSGTVPTPLVVGLGAACEIAQHEISNDEKRVTELSKKLINEITKRCTHVILNGDPESRYPGCVNLSFAYVEGESLLMALKDIALSSG